MKHKTAIKKGLFFMPVPYTLDPGPFTLNPFLVTPEARA
jgi:hypothetical protein